MMNDFQTTLARRPSNNSRIFSDGDEPVDAFPRSIVMFNLGLKKQKEQLVAVDYFKKHSEHKQALDFVVPEGQHTFEFYLGKYNNECHEMLEKRSKQNEIYKNIIFEH